MARGRIVRTALEQLKIILKDNYESQLRVLESFEKENQVRADLTLQAQEWWLA